MEANYISTFKKERHIEEEPEDQRRLWESKKVGNKCKASFVRESGHFLCNSTGLTDQNRSSLVQEPWQWSPRSSKTNDSITLPLLHGHVSQYITTSPSSPAGQLLTGCLASLQSQTEKCLL